MEHLIETIGRNMFAIFGVMALGSAAFMVLSRSAVHSVLGFLFAMLCIAGCVLSLEAEFLSMAQILVYAGGIVVLFLFVVMLVEMSKKSGTEVFQLQSRYAVVAVLAGAAAFLGIFRKVFVPSLSVRDPSNSNRDLAGIKAVLGLGVFLEDTALFQFGIRSGGADEWQLAQQHKTIRPFTVEAIREVLKGLGDRPIYITLDMDVLDPSLYPGTGTPEPGGIDYSTLLAGLKCFQGLNLVGMDCLELAPHYDPSGVSAITMAKTLRELIILAHKRRRA